MTLFPTAALPASGFMGIISARKGTPVVCVKDIIILVINRKSFDFILIV